MYRLYSSNKLSHVKKSFILTQKTVSETFKFDALDPFLAICRDFLLSIFQDLESQCKVGEVSALVYIKNIIITDA